MTKKSDAPAIRFKGFSDAWEQRKLSAIADKVTVINVGLQYIETFTNSAEFGIISQRDFFDHDIAKMSCLGGYYIVRSEDFDYNTRISTSAPVRPINHNNIGRIGEMSPLYTVYIFNYIRLLLTTTGVVRIATNMYLLTLFSLSFLILTEANISTLY